MRWREAIVVILRAEVRSLAIVFGICIEGLGEKVSEGE